MSLPHHHRIIYLLLPLLLILQCHSASAGYDCPPNIPWFVSNSTYESNLKLLLADMDAATPIHMKYNSSKGKPPDEVFGVAVCLKNRSRSICSTCADPVCKDCMDRAVAGALTSCGNKKIAAGMFDNCIIAWSDRYAGSPPSPPPPWTPVESHPPPPPPPMSLESPPPFAPMNGRNATSGEAIDSGKKSVLTYAVVIPVVLGIVIVAGLLWLLPWKRWRKGKVPLPESPADEPFGAFIVDSDLQSVMYSYQDLRNATGGFAESNLLGEGGFGPVYKGTLQDGQQIAVKKLKNGWQGIEQLGNEVRLVKELQHRNLVRVLGCCMEEKEAMLVYELLPNTSLDKFLKDPSKCEQLTWAIRFKIIKGISRGMLYLHQDSRQLIIHRDLKTSNILLDEEMNPKISDFGLAKLYNDTQTHANTTKIAGTKGYIAPECLQRGEYSFKSDVYSFGIIVLEIVTGKLVSSFDDTGRGLVNYVTQHWNEGDPLRAMDSDLRGGFSPEEVTTSLYVGLRCSQMDMNVRPDIGSVVSMLSSRLPMSETMLNFTF